MGDHHHDHLHVSTCHHADRADQPRRVEHGSRPDLHFQLQHLRGGAGVLRSGTALSDVLRRSEHALGQRRDSSFHGGRAATFHRVLGKARTASQAG